MKSPRIAFWSVFAYIRLNCVRQRENNVRSEILPEHGDIYFRSWYLNIFSVI